MRCERVRDPVRSLSLEKCRGQPGLSPAGLREDELGSGVRPRHSPFYLGIAGCFPFLFFLSLVGLGLRSVFVPLLLSAFLWSIPLLLPLSPGHGVVSSISVTVLLQSYEAGQVIFCSLQTRPQVS